MDSVKVRQLFFLAVIGALSLATILLLGNNQTLKQKNTSLLQESEKLRVSLDELETRNKELIENEEKNKGLLKENKSLKDQIEEIRHEHESLQLELKKLETQASSATEEKTYLEEMLINKTREIEAMKKNSPGPSQPLPASGTATAAGTPVEIVEKIKQKDEEIRRLNEQNKILSEKLERLHKTTNDKIAEINIAKIALEESVSSARKKIDDEWSTVNLGSITLDKRGNPPAKTEPRQQPKKEGFVLAVNEDHGFVVVNLGKVDNLSSDAKLSVKKNGQTIATLTVLEIRDVMTACNIRDLKDGQKIQINDLVSIQK